MFVRGNMKDRLHKKAGKSTSWCERQKNKCVCMCVCFCAQVCAAETATLQKARWIRSSLPQMKTRACIVFWKHCWAHVPSGVEKSKKKAGSHNITSTNCTSQVKMPPWINVCPMAKVHRARMWHVCHSMAAAERVHYDLLKLPHWPLDHHAAHL